MNIPTTPERLASIKEAAAQGHRTLYVYEDPDAPEQLDGVSTTPFLARTPYDADVWAVKPNGQIIHLPADTILMVAES